MKNIAILLFINFITFPLFSQTSFDKGYLFTRIGTHSFNEINLGYGMKDKKGNRYEFMLGRDLASGFWDGACQPAGLLGGEVIQLSTELKGTNFRATFYPSITKKLGLTALFRSASSNRFVYEPSCVENSSTYYPLEYYNDIKIRDFGGMVTFHMNNSERFSFLISPGIVFRNYNRARSLTSNYFVFNIAMQVKFSRKRDLE